MTADDMLHRMLQKIPGAEYRDFIHEVNASVDRICKIRNWHWMQTSYTFVLTAPYSTGTVAMTNGLNSITGTGTTWTSAMSTRKIRFNGESVDYTFTYVSGTSGTLDRVYSGTTDTDATYKIYQDVYSLPSTYKNYISLVDVDYNVDLQEYSKAMYWERGSARLPANWNNFPHYGFCIFGKDSSNNVRIQLFNQPDTTNTLEFLYWKLPTALTDMADEPDLPDWLHEAVYLHVLSKYQRRHRADDKAEIAATKADFAEEMAVCMTMDANMTRPEMRNKPRLLRL